VSAPDPAESPSTASARLDAALRRVHRAVLAFIAACALVAATQTEDPAASPSRAATIAALALAAVSVVARRLATLTTAEPRRRLTAALTGLVAAAAVAAVGAIAAAIQGQARTGLVFCLAALLFSLRPPRLAPPAARSR
jgi:hypothetical protein